MQRRQIRENLWWLGAIDWDRRLFDALIPLPDGTSYNAYLVQGHQKTALIDTVDPPFIPALLEQLGDTPVDYVVSHHAEPDHSGGVAALLGRYPGAKAVCTPKCASMLQDLFGIPPDRFLTVNDGQTLELGGRTLEILHMPWVHWPETMVSYLREDRLLFSCDLFGSHIATTELFVTDRCRVYEAAKRYYAEIMMPFAATIARHLERLAKFEVGLIAPSHGALHPDPRFILDAYRDWTTSAPRNFAVIPFVSMHGSTRMMVEILTEELVARGVHVQRHDLAETDIGKLGMSLVDAATIVLGTPTVLTGAHPKALYAAELANLLRPKARYASVIGSYGWGTKVVEQVTAALSNLKVELLPPVLGRGRPKAAEREGLAKLAERIAELHKGLPEVGGTPC